MPLGAALGLYRNAADHDMTRPNTIPSHETSRVSERPTLHVAFEPFWKSFDPYDNFITRILDKKFRVVHGSNADLVFYGPGKSGISHPTCESMRVCFIYENVRPDMSKSDWCFSFDYDGEVRHPRHMRLPLYVIDERAKAFRSEWVRLLVKSPDFADSVIAQRSRSKFCTYVAYTDKGMRLHLFDRLSQYSRVVAPGRSRNNAAPISDGDPERSRGNPDWGDLKRKYLQQFRFCLSCEHSSYPGYTSEKIVDAMLAGCIPIYWGNPEIDREFNPESFVNVTEYEQDAARQWPAWIRRMPRLYKRIHKNWILPRAVEKTAQRVAAINESMALYRQILSEPWFNNNKPNEYFDQERLEHRLYEIGYSALKRQVSVR